MNVELSAEGQPVTEAKVLRTRKFRRGGNDYVFHTMETGLVRIYRLYKSGFAHGWSQYIDSVEAIEEAIEYVKDLEAS